MFRQSGFSQTHKIGNIGINAKLCIPIHLQFPPLVAPYDASKCETKCQLLCVDYVSRLQTLLVLFISNGTVNEVDNIGVLVLCSLQKLLVGKRRFNFDTSNGSNVGVRIVKL